MKRLHLSLVMLFASVIFIQAQEFRNCCSAHKIERYKSFGQFQKQHKSHVGSDYDIVWHRCYWEVDPAVRFISGSVTSLFKSLDNSLSQVDFELHSHMSVDSVIYHGNSLIFNHSNHVLNIFLTDTLGLNEYDSLSVYYHGVPPISGGFGAFGQDTLNPDPVIWTLSQPYGAKFWWPSKNDLSDKIDSIDIFVRTPEGNRVASNGALVSVTTGNNESVFHWRHRYPIATYLVAIAVTNYDEYIQNVPLSGGNLPVFNYYYPHDSLGAISALDNFLPVYAFLDSLFIEYPFMSEKYGHAQFSWGGGMEHQTMSFMGTWSWDILVHELAHQWFGNYITCGSWQDIWLNEGFATYLTGLAYERLAPHLWPLWLNSNITHVVSHTDGSVFVDDTTNVWRIFNSRLSYSKGALVLHMLRHVMGDDDFFQGVRNYLNDPALAHGYAYTDDLKGHLESACNCSLTDFFDIWVYGEGYPSYTINIEEHSGNNYKAEVSQTTSHFSVGFFAMPLPLRFYGEGRDTTFLLDHQNNGQVFWLDPRFKADSVAFDPDLRLISKNNKLTLNIINHTEPKDFHIYPNPAEHSLFIIHNGEQFEWSISGMDARTVLSGKAQTHAKEKIDVSSLSHGVYILNIYHTRGVLTKKFIK